MVSRRFWSTVLLSLGAVLGTAPALAQTDTTTTSTTAALAATDFTFKLRRLDGDEWVDITTTDQKLFFNQARCQCDEEVKIVITLASTAIVKLGSVNTPGAKARLYVGDNCAGVTLGNVNCPNGLIAEQSGLSVFTKQGWEVTAKIRDLFKQVASCDETRDIILWLWINTAAGSQPDLTGDSAPHFGISLNGTPPSAPYDVTVEGGNEALKVTWADMNADTSDLAGYVVFCMRGNGIQVFNPGYWDDQYMTCSGVTPIGASSTTSSLKGNTSALEVEAPAPFKELDNRFMCSGRISASDTSTRIRVLQNGIPYTVGVAAVDLSGNISPITSAFVQKPIPTVDFYPAYRDAQGESEGGYCSLGGWHGRPGAMANLAGAGLLGLFFLRRHRRRRSGRGGLTVLLLLLAAAPAQAQSASTSPQTREDLSKTFQEPRSYRTDKDFAFELRFGAYRPDVDSEFSDPAVHPYKDVYGGKRHLMSQFEFDWQFFQGFGSLSLGAAVGYYSQTAKAFEADPTGKPKLDENGAFIRSGDDTTLRLIPTAALLVYRFDVLALRYGFPLVPYAKLGLNYTFWRITDADGNISHYLGGHGSGGTVGWQAAAGISLMLDFIDPTAARGLDLETGVNHTYVFFEWNKVEANGLGQSKKLHVGDSSWVLGLLFEF